MEMDVPDIREDFPEEELIGKPLERIRVCPVGAMFRFEGVDFDLGVMCALKVDVGETISTEPNGSFTALGGLTRTMRVVIYKHSEGPFKVWAMGEDVDTGEDVIFGLPFSGARKLENPDGWVLEFGSEYEVAVDSVGIAHRRIVRRAN